MKERMDQSWRIGSSGSANRRFREWTSHGAGTRRYPSARSLITKALDWRRYALRIPGMTLALGMLQPLIQGVIEEKTARQHFLVVGVQSREAEGEGEQPGRSSAWEP